MKRKRVSIWHHKGLGTLSWTCFCLFSAFCLSQRSHFSKHVFWFCINTQHQCKKNVLNFHSRRPPSFPICRQQVGSSLQYNMNKDTFVQFSVLHFWFLHSKNVFQHDLLLWMFDHWWEELLQVCLSGSARGFGLTFFVVTGELICVLFVFVFVLLVCCRLALSGFTRFRVLQWHLKP